MPTRPVATRSAVAPALVQAGGNVNIGSSAFYSSGGQFDLPEGAYALELWTAMFSPNAGKTGKAPAKPFLAVMVQFHPLDGSEAGEAKPFGVGSGAEKSFAPSADSRGFDAIPGPNAKSTVSGISNWHYFRKSLIDCCPEIEQIFQNDVKVLDGLWVQTANIPEPQERLDVIARMKNKGRTGEAAGVAEEEERGGPRNITVVTEVLEGGKPWENGGGFPTPGVAAAPAPVAAPRATPPARPGAPVRTVPAPAARAAAAPPARRGAPAPAPVAAAPAADTEDIASTVLSLMGDWFMANPNGGSALQLRSGVFTAAGNQFGADYAQAVQEYNSDPAAFASLIGQLGYVQKGISISPAA